MDMLAAHASAATVGAGLVGTGRGVDDGFSGAGSLVVGAAGVAAAGDADVFVGVGVFVAADGDVLGTDGRVADADAFTDGDVLAGDGADSVACGTGRGDDETMSGTKPAEPPLAVAETARSGFLAAPACAGWHAASAIPTRAAAQSTRRFMLSPSQCV